MVKPLDSQIADDGVRYQDDQKNLGKNLQKKKCDMLSSNYMKLQQRMAKN